MKYCGSTTTMSSQNESEVESLLMSPCWSQTQNGGQDQFLLDGHKLLLEHDLDSLQSDSDQKSSLDVLDNLLMSSSSINASLADLKPLPPFAGYTGHLSINGISGHHYHAIAQRLPEENNNNYSQTTYQNQTGSSGGSGGHDIVSSSTCLPDSMLSDTSETCLRDVKLFSESQLENKLYSVADSCLMNSSSSGPDSVSGGVRIYADSKELSEYVDMSSIEDIAAIIGSAIADTTVRQGDNEDGNDTRDSWMDLDAWIDGNCVQQDGKLIVSQQDAINEFILPNSPPHTSSSTLQSLLTHGYMPLLQNRLQNGPPLKSEASSSTSFCGGNGGEIISTTASPPGSVVSTTDNIMINGRYLTNTTNPHHYQVSMSALKPDGLCSPELMTNFPHTTTANTINSPSGSTKNKRARSQKKSSGSTLHQQQQQQQQHLHQQQQSQLNNGNVGVATGILAPTSVNFNSASDLSGLLGKEKPVHRCNICNRGFLNKSNIKVHLRTHTGEKPFRCDVCSKAFRQKAHLLKHQQIHKRIGRD